MKTSSDVLFIWEAYFITEIIKQNHMTYLASYRLSDIVSFYVNCYSEKNDNKLADTRRNLVLRKPDFHYGIVSPFWLNI